jgi:CubicO group peptidase (beta-lactamase class C family)
MHPGLRRAVAATAALLVLAVGCDDDPGSQPDRPQPAPQDTDIFDPADLPEGSSGTLVAGVDGRMLSCEGWGLADKETGAEADCDTVYDVGSITKQFTAAAILKLQMMGRLRVTDRIGRFLDDVPADKRAITIQQLLTHTAGFVDALGGDYKPLSRADLVAAAFASELSWRRGTHYRYSNVGYSLLGAIVEEASGEGYEEFLAEHLFRPAGMTSTGYVLPDWDSADVAVEYDGQGRPQGRPFEHPWAQDGPYWNLLGNGGLLSTARDMFRWYQALEGDEVLDERAERELFQPRVREGPHADTRYAYGWVVLGTAYGPVQWHNGGNGWSYAEIARIPEAHAFVFWVTNQVRSRSGVWNLERLGSDLTSDVGRRLVEASASDG